MVITAAEWARYRTRLSQVCQRAADMMQRYVLEHGYEVNDELIGYAYSLATQYGEAAAELACIMYDDMAAYWAMSSPERRAFESAIPAETATYGETAAAMKAVGKESPSTIPDVVGRMVKRAAADTTMQNAIRDGAQFAWIPSGDTCAFCLTLASRGWQYASKKSIKNGHAEHIHANCDCQYAVRFDNKTTYAGYDPDKYRKMYDEAEGDTPKDKINAMRRDIATKKRVAEERNSSLHLNSIESIIKYCPDIHIGNSVGAKLKDTFVRLPDGEEVLLTPGQKITKVQTIAGAGRDREIDELPVLLDRYPGTKPELWQKRKGIGYVDYDGESFRAELHWYEEPSVGRVEYKVKPDAGGNWFYED